MRCKWFGHKFFYQSLGFGPTKNGIKGEYCWCKKCGKAPWQVEFKTKKDYVTDGTLSWWLNDKYYE